MLDPDTFLTALYVTVDDCCKMRDEGRHVAPGAHAALSPSEVVTLSLFAEWHTFPSERAFYRYAARHLRCAFPCLPSRAQLNRQIRAQEPLVRAVFTALVERLVPTPPPYEIIDTTGVATRNVRRHGLGWLSGQADVGKSTRLGWYEGFHLLTTVTPTGVLTGFGFGPASTKETPLAETFFAARHGARLAPNAVPPLATTLAVGPTCPDCYVGDGGFESTERQRRWWQWYHTALLAPPRRSARGSWPQPLRTWLATLRQTVESVYVKLHYVFRLALERPHALSGFRARLAAMAALHNFCIWMNRELGRPDLAFADLIDW